MKPGTVKLVQNVDLGHTKVIQIRQRETLSHQGAIIHENCCSAAHWMKGEVETQFSLSGLLLHTQPLHSSEQHTRAHLEFSSNFGYMPPQFIQKFQ